MQEGDGRAGIECFLLRHGPADLWLVCGRISEDTDDASAEIREVVVFGAIGLVLEPVPGHQWQSAVLALVAALPSDSLRFEVVGDMHSRLPLIARR